MRSGYTLELWGAGTDWESFRAMIEPGDNIVLHGPTVRAEDVYDKLALYVTAARYEGLPVSVLEAMASDLPVIASDIDGHRVINEIARENGFAPPLTLFRSEDADELARLIEKFLTAPWQAETRELTQVVFSGEKHCEGLKKLLEEHWLHDTQHAEADVKTEQEKEP